MPIHGSILRLIGWRLTRGGSELLADPSERIAAMRQGRFDLVRATGEDFGFNLSAWRDHLLGNKELGYKHPYAFATVDRAVRNAMSDEEAARLATIASGEKKAG
ncbi:MAG TPA: hypothetical protein VGR35_04405 [Tepidisphaeraceae bacterium]|nr:hypothetical protein [Tepidisphaeraceae bacterium]